MASTYQQVVDNVRKELGDTYSDNYTYSDADMTHYAAQGVLDMWNKKPSLKYDLSTGRLYDESAVIPASDVQLYYTVPIPSNLICAVEAYVVFRCLSRDNTDSGNAAAAQICKERYDALIGG